MIKVSRVHGAREQGPYLGGATRKVLFVVQLKSAAMADALFSLLSLCKSEPENRKFLQYVYRYISLSICVCVCVYIYTYRNKGPRV